jgi:ATP-dependent protease HslVU (ClpYQ) peptidase subunit
MTCIAGVAVDNRVCIGADSAAGAGWVTRVTRLPKVFRLGQFLIGYTSSFRMGQILQHHLEVRLQRDDEPDDAYLVRVFVEEVRASLKRHGFARVESNVEKGGVFLVGYRGRLYHFDDDFQLNEPADGMDACGCGEEFALGALKALEALPPRERVVRALEVAAYFSGGVIGPFHVLEA